MMRTWIKLSAAVLAACTGLTLAGCDKAQDSASTSEGAVTSGAPASPTSAEASSEAA